MKFLLKNGRKARRTTLLSVWNSGLMSWNSVWLRYGQSWADRSWWCHWWIEEATLACVCAKGHHKRIYLDNSRSVLLIWKREHSGFIWTLLKWWLLMDLPSPLFLFPSLPSLLPFISPKFEIWYRWPSCRFWSDRLSPPAVSSWL